MNRRSVVLDATVALVFDGVIVLSLYLLFAGHNQPGGGFVGGLVAAAGVALRFIAGGADDVRSLLAIRPWGYLAAGLALAAGMALWPLAFGTAPLDQSAATFEVPLVGTMKLTTATIFDAGVYLIVVGLAFMIFEALGDEPDDTEPPVDDAMSGQASP